MRVGFIGAGRMGRPMVERLVAADHEVRVLGRTGEKRAALAEAGATPVAAATGVADQADVVCVCVFSDDQVREICLDGDLLSAMPTRSVLIIHTTGSPRTAAAIADSATARTRDIGVLDAPVSGGPHDIAAGRITLLAGGDKEHFDRARPALSAYGDPILHLGPLGNGQAVKLVNNALFAANIGLVTAAARLGGEFGIEEKTLLNALTQGSSASRALAGAAARGSAEDFATAIAEFLGKDVAVVRNVAAEFGTDLGVLGAAIDELAQLTDTSAHPPGRAPE